MLDRDKYFVRNNFKSKFVRRLRNIVKFHCENDINIKVNETRVLEDVSTPIFKENINEIKLNKTI